MKLLVMELGPGAHPRVRHPDGQTFWPMVHAVRHCLIPEPQCHWTPGPSVPLAYANIHHPRYMDFPSGRWYRPLHPASPLCLLLDVFSHPSSGPAALRPFLGASPFLFLSSPFLFSPLLSSLPPPRPSLFFSSFPSPLYSSSFCLVLSCFLFLFSAFLSLTASYTASFCFIPHCHFFLLSLLLTSTFVFPLHWHPLHSSC